MSHQLAQKVDRILMSQLAVADNEIKKYMGSIGPAERIELSITLKEIERQTRNLIATLFADEMADKDKEERFLFLVEIRTIIEGTLESKEYTVPKTLYSKEFWNLLLSKDAKNKKAA